MGLRRVYILIILHFILIEVGQSQQLLDSLKNKLKIVSGKEKIQTMINLSEAYRYDDFDSCVFYGDRAVQIAKEKGFKDLEALGLKSIGVTYYFIGNLEDSYSYYLNSYNVYSLVNDTLGLANCLNNIGILMEEWGDIDAAEEYYENSLNLKYLIDDQEGIASSLQLLGNICFYKNKYQKAIDYYYKALEIFRKNNNLNYQALCLNNIGNVYMRWNRQVKALEFFKLAEKMFRGINDMKMLSSVLLNSAEIYNFEYQNYDTALTLYNESLKLKEKLNDNIGIALIKNNIGTLYGNMKDYNLAYKYFNESKHLYQKLEAVGGVIMVEYNMGKVYQAQKNFQQAIKYFKTSLLSANDYGFVDYISSNQEALFECYAAVCDYEKFEKYYQLFKTGQDTLLDRVNEAEMLEIEAKYSAETANHKSDQLQEKLNSAEKELWIYQLILTSLFGIAAVLMFTYLIRMLKKK